MSVFHRLAIYSLQVASHNWGFQQKLEFSRNIELFLKMNCTMRSRLEEVIFPRRSGSWIPMRLDSLADGGVDAQLVWCM